MHTREQACVSRPFCEAEAEIEGSAVANTMGQGRRVKQKVRDKKKKKPDSDGFICFPLSFMVFLAFISCLF